MKTRTNYTFDFGADEATDVFLITPHTHYTDRGVQYSIHSHDGVSIQLNQTQLDILFSKMVPHVTSIKYGGNNMAPREG